MGILFHDRQYPAHKNKEVVAAWFRALEKYPQPEGLFTTLIDNAARPTKQGIKIFSAHLIPLANTRKQWIIGPNL
jgi:hypothetical protein